MGKILCIETSTEVCSVAIAVNGKVIDFVEDLTGQNHSKLLTVYIDELLQKYSLKVSDFDAVAVSKGPGSYTGLRIGASVAKGLCYAANLPLIAICPIEAMAITTIDYFNELNNINPPTWYMPMIDARRMEVYTGIWDNNGNNLVEVHARIVDSNSQDDLGLEGTCCYFGNGAEKCKAILPPERFVYHEGVITTARNMAKLANIAFNAGKFEDLAYFEPHYLKEFIAIVGKNKVL